MYIGFENSKVKDLRERRCSSSRLAPRPPVFILGQDLLQPGAEFGEFFLLARQALRLIVHALPARRNDIAALRGFGDFLFALLQLFAAQLNFLYQRQHETFQPQSCLAMADLMDFQDAAG